MPACCNIIRFARSPGHEARVSPSLCVAKTTGGGGGVCVGADERRLRLLLLLLLVVVVAGGGAVSVNAIRELYRDVITRF
jgi:hypothetical protein